MSSLLFRMKTLLPLLMLLWIAAGCAHTPPVLLCNAAVENDTSRDILDFRIIHHPTERMLTANRILAGSSIQLGVPHPELKATSATLTWQDALWGPRRIDVLIPHPSGAGRRRQLIYTIHASGLAEAAFAPCP